MSDNGQIIKLPVIPGAPEEKPLEVEDLSNLVPDISQAIKAPEHKSTNGRRTATPCPICGVVDCGSWEAELARQRNFFP